MALKTFNLDQEVYKQFSDHCKKNGISMSKKVENFIREELDKLSYTTTKRPEKDDHPLKKYC